VPQEVKSLKIKFKCMLIYFVILICLKSLSGLINFIKGRSEGLDQTLVKLLSKFLKGNALTSFIINCSPYIEHIDTTVLTLK